MPAEGRLDHSLDTIADDVSYAAYLEDTEQIAWWESVAPGMRGKNGAIAKGSAFKGRLERAHFPRDACTSIARSAPAAWSSTPLT